MLLRRASTRYGALATPPTQLASRQACPSLKGWAARVSRAASTKSKRVSLSLSDLPSHKLDAEGHQVGPLEDFLEGAKSTPAKVSKKSTSPSRKPSVSTVDSEEADYRRAVAAGTIPETDLARLVWENWRRFPDCVLLTQVGNFYESYFEPAIQLSSLLGIKLTSKTYKTGSFPFTGFPIHQRDKYLKLLVHDLGQTVAVVDEQHDPLQPVRDTGNIVRKVARIVTPGTLIDEHWLTGNESRYLLAIAAGEPPSEVEGEEADAQNQLPLYLAYADVSTGEFFTKAATLGQIEDELARIVPREVVLDSKWRDAWETEDTESGVSGSLLPLLRVLGVHVSFTDFEPASVDVTKPKRNTSLTPGQLERQAITLLRQHLQYALRDSMPPIPEDPEDFSRESETTQMHIDAATLQALEIRHVYRPGGGAATGPGSSTLLLSQKGTLLSVIDRPVTDSGGRLLRRTLSAPSTSLPFINARLALVSSLKEREALRTDIRDQLRSLSDVMRILQRFRSRRGDGSDVWDVARWIRSVQQVLDRLQIAISFEGRKTSRKGTSDQAEGIDRLAEFVAAFQPLEDLALSIEDAIDQEHIPRRQPEDGEDGVEAAGDAMVEPVKPTARTRREEEERKREDNERKMWWIRPSFSTELRDLHRRIKRFHAARDKMEADLREQYAAPSLTLVSNNRNGFVVHVKKKSEGTQLAASDLFHTVSESRSSRTFAYSEWSTLGSKLDRAFQELGVAQTRAMIRLRAMVLEHGETIRHNAELIDELDMANAFAQTAIDLNYVRPTVHEGTELDIVNGRHPSVEAGLLHSARTFTPNSTHMTPSSHLHVITGPNQGGKSTLLRQAAVITILAQSGCFVPADSAEVGVVDRVFSRVGARDDLYRDRSTFMLEMIETAAILKHATPRSLVIMDEIGRGTTLNAGMAIAYATLDYILNHIKCRTLFATHYHELASMLGGNTETSNGVALVSDPKDVRPGVSFWCTDVDEMGDSFAYSYRLKPGINFNSHAIKAAQLAGMPPNFLEAAQTTLEALDAADSRSSNPAS